MRPRILLKSSSAVDAAVERGNSSLANSVARAMNVERGSVMPRVAWMRFWIESTEDRDIGTAISVSVISSSIAVVG